MIQVDKQSRRMYYGEQGPNQCRATVLLPEQPKMIVAPMNCTLALGHAGAHEHASCYLTITWQVGSGNQPSSAERAATTRRSAAQESSSQTGTNVPPQDQNT